MPISPPGLTAALITGMTSTGNLGQAVPQLAQGLAQGTFDWLQASQVVSVDTGTLGVGVGLGPFLVPEPVLLPALLTGFTTFGLLGPMAPLLATGLSIGFNLGFLQGLIQTTSAGVGLGAGVAQLVPIPAFPFLQAGLSGVGMVGPGVVQKANAVSLAFTVVFGTLKFPLAIAGPPSILPGAGVGIGKVI